MAHLGTGVDERTLVIVPTYNESATIPELVRRLFDATGDKVELLVVDDGSPDGTADVVRNLIEGPHEIHLLERPGKAGLGTAYVTGFRWALQRGYGAVMEMDADLSHDPADVPRLLAALATADLVIGSRYVPGGSIPGWSFFRRALSSMGNVYARTWLGFGVRGSTSGFRAYRTSMLKQFDLGTIKSEGYAFQIEMTWRVHLLRGRITEVPISFVDRTMGRSKMSRAIALEALGRVTKWGLKRLFRRTGP